MPCLDLDEMAQSVVANHKMTIKLITSQIIIGCVKLLGTENICDKFFQPTLKMLFQIVIAIANYSSNQRKMAMLIRGGP